MARFAPTTLFLLSVCILLFSACREKADAAKSGKPQGAPPVIVDVIVAASHSIDNKVEANGSVVANEYVELHPEISGRITYTMTGWAPWGLPLLAASAFSRQAEKRRIQTE